MALWNNLGQAATVAQLAGVDIGGLISMIVQAVQTVHRNREECRHLMHHVMMIGDLLQMLQQSEMVQNPEIRRPLDGLEETLRQAYLLVTSCQQHNLMRRFFMARNQAQRFRDVRDRIDSYLRIYPLISHIDTKYYISGLYSRTHPSIAQPQASEEALGSLSSHSNPGSQIEGRTSVNSGIGSVQDQAVTESFAVEEQQQDGVLFSGLKGIHQQPNPSMGSLVMKEQLVLQFSSSHNVIGRGAFGHVYKGVFPNGVDVAVKTARGEYTSTRSEFENEVRIIPKLQHANIIKLLGCCFEGGNRALVYEYMPNGSLDNRICELSAGVLLAWPTRFRIIEGIAQGALYLHQHSRLRVIHGDLKPSNILLDYDMTPRIIDFGMAQVLSSDEDEKEVDTVAGTLGYIDPNFFCTKIISIKSDVYAFGVTTLVIITARRTFRHSSPEMQPLVTDAWELWSSERAIELVDPSLCNEPRIDDILRCIQIALLCVQENSADRPTMSDVLIMLNCECMTLPVPRPPARRVRQGAGESLADASETAGITHHTENEVQATIDNAIVVA